MPEEKDQRIAELEAQSRNWETACRVNVASQDAEIERLRTALESASTLISAFETCHICTATILVAEGPIHCENCSYDCEDHEDPDCVGLEVLHANAKRLVSAARSGAPVAPAPIWPRCECGGVGTRAR